MRNYAETIYDADGTDIDGSATHQEANAANKP